MASVLNRVIPQEIVPGDPLALGASHDGDGVNFALFSQHAERVELCIFDAAGENELGRYDLPECTHAIWHGYVPGLSPALSYGYRVDGRYEPSEGYRFNPNKLLLDPYARQLRSTFRWHVSHFAYASGSTDADAVMDCSDNARWMPKAAISAAGERGTARPKAARPWHESVVYELNLRGFTLQHPGLSESERGRFAGLSSKQVVEYLRALGITAVELLPVQSFVDEYALHQRGLSNYWGYNPLNYFAPQPGYLSDGDCGEIRRAFDVLHDAGIEVILDVVYNHTAEGNELGPTLSYRGIDNLSYYRLDDNNAGQYLNDSGCGNTLRVQHPRVMQLVMDSLRHWVSEYGVDGFRFDLATMLGRTAQGFDANSAVLQAIAQDPVLSRVKMIAEPWDIGPGGYQLGGFPAGWSEWNDRYRDTVRRYWRGEDGVLPELARRLHGSADLFEHSGRAPSASINLVTAHDGFTLRDLLTYSERRNEANGENNRDGHHGNLANNCGFEGECDDPAVNALRLRQAKNMLATLMLSQGIPMLTAGDEFGRTQQGNNNAYCQDNAISWLDWSLVDSNRELLEFVRQLVSLRRRYPVSRFARYTHASEGLEQPGIHWVCETGEEFEYEHWHDTKRRVIGYLMLPGATTADDTGAAEALLVFMNSSERDHSICMPDIGAYSDWSGLLDTAASSIADRTVEVAAGRHAMLTACSLQVYSATARVGNS